MPDLPDPDAASSGLSGRPILPIIDMPREEPTTEEEQPPEMVDSSDEDAPASTVQYDDFPGFDAEPQEDLYVLTEDDMWKTQAVDNRIAS